MILLKMISFVFLSKMIEHPNGKCGKLSSISFFTGVVVLPIKAQNLFSKLYSGLAYQTKSKTVKHSLSSANLKPLPNC